MLVGKDSVPFEIRTGRIGLWAVTVKVGGCGSQDGGQWQSGLWAVAVMTVGLWQSGQWGCGS